MDGMKHLLFPFTVAVSVILTILALLSGMSAYMNHLLKVALR